MDHAALEVVIDASLHAVISVTDAKFPRAPRNALLSWLWRNSSKIVLIAIGSIIAAMALLFVQAMQAEREARAQSLTSTNVMGELREVVRMGIESETGQRGYLLTDDLSFLRPYEYSKGRLVPAIDRIGSRLKADGSREEQQIITEMREMAVAKLDEQERTVALARSGEREAAVRIVSNKLGQSLMDEFRRLAAQLEQRQAARMKIAAQHAEATQARTSSMLIWLLLAIVALASFTLLRDRKANRAAFLAQESELLRQGKERADLIAQELNHRVKNLFAVILSLVGLSARGSTDVPSTVEKIRNRIYALSTAHSISQGKSDVQRFELKELLTAILAPYNNADATISMDGPETELSSDAITPLGLIFHEVATNALKYGGLSAPGGSVAVRWRIDGSHLELVWAERGGPPAKPGKSSGFGSTLIHATAEQLGGTIENDWADQGLTMTLRFPVA